MKRKIIKYPNKILNIESENVVEFGSELHNLLDNMSEILKKANNGIGLAAIQIGVPLKVIILNLPNKSKIEAINPRIVSTKGTKTMNEGCLSLSGVNAFINRANSIVVAYQDRYGNLETMKATGLLSRAWQHEIEHLSGKLYIDKLSNTQRKKIEAQYKKASK